MKATYKRIIEAAVSAARPVQNKHLWLVIIQSMNGIRLVDVHSQYCTNNHPDKSYELCKVTQPPCIIAVHGYNM